MAKLAKWGSTEMELAARVIYILREEGKIDIKAKTLKLHNATIGVILEAALLLEEPLVVDIIGGSLKISLRSQE